MRQVVLLKYRNSISVLYVEQKIFLDLGLADVSNFRISRRFVFIGRNRKNVDDQTN